MNNTDLEYQRLLRLILEKGRVKKNRTGVDTIGVFGAQARFNLAEGFPLLTTKKMAVKAITHELLWFIKGDTNIKYLVDNNCNIWNGDCYRKYRTTWVKEGLSICVDGAKWGKDIGARSYEMLTQEEFIGKIKIDAEFAAKWGDLGQGTYGQMWRAFPYASYWEIPRGASYAGSRTGHELKTVDQLQKVIDKLKTNPDDRRMIVSAWHPYWVDHCALPPCHCLFHFNTEELTWEERLSLYAKDGSNPNELPEHIQVDHKFYDDLGIPRRRLNCLLYQRSCDTFLGVPFNIASYGLLTSMVAHVTNMVAGEFIHTYGDLHIYQNHLEQVKEQLTREPMKLPTLWLNPKVTNLFDFTINDIRIDNYESHPAIKGEISTG